MKRATTANRLRAKRRLSTLGIGWLCVAVGCFGATQTAWAINSIQVLGLFPDRAVVEVDGKRRVLSLGTSSPEGVTLISADSESAVIEFGGHRRTFKLGRRITTVYRAPAVRPSIRIWPSVDGVYRTSGSINGYPVDYLVDTGARSVAMSRIEAKRLGINFRAKGKLGRAMTASGPVDAYAVVLARVRVGEIELTNVAASVVDRDFPTNVLLGNSFLDRLEMKREGRAMEFRARP